MRSFGVRLPILAVTAWAGIGLSVSAMGYRYGETVYVSPTVATFGWPASYETTAAYVPTHTAIPVTYPRHTATPVFTIRRLTRMILSRWHLRRI